MPYRLKLCPVSRRCRLKAILVVVEADDRATEVLEVLNRYNAVPGGVRMPID